MRNKDIPLSTKQMLLDISSMLPRANQFAQKEGRYNITLKRLLEMNFLSNPDNQFPPLKEICKELNMDMKQLRIHIKRIYEMLIFGGDNENNNDTVFNLDKVVYIFRVQGSLKTFLSFEVKNLKVIPRTGEGIILPFFKAYLGGVDTFYVDGIFHNFENQQHKVYIDLRVGGYNRYWEFRLDEAEIKNEISISERLNLSTIDLIRKLKVY